MSGQGLQVILGNCGISSLRLRTGESTKNSDFGQNCSLMQRVCFGRNGECDNFLPDASWELNQFRVSAAACLEEKKERAQVST